MAEPAVLYLQQVEERQIDQRLKRAALEASLLQQIRKHKEDAKLHPRQNEGPDAARKKQKARRGLVSGGGILFLFISMTLSLIINFEYNRMSQAL
jgi:hypothetical protein